MLRLQQNTITITSRIKRFSTSPDDVLFQELGRSKKIGVITLNRPKALNSLNLSVISHLHAQLQKWQKSVSLVLIKGSGEKAFSAGADIKAIAEQFKMNDPKGEEYLRFEYATEYLIGNYKIPYIALIHGVTMGGGAGISVLGKYRVATEKTMLAMPETGIGLHPDSGASYFLSRLPNQIGLYCGLTGYRLTGLDVMKSGLATHYCDWNKVKSLEQDLININTVEEISPILDKYTQESIRDKDKPFILDSKRIQIEKHFSFNTVENIIKSLESEKSEWAFKQIETLMKMSPTSLKVTLQLFRIAKNWPLKECLKMDFCLVMRLLGENDFYEGVRATIIDKENNPKWNPAKLGDVSDDKVASFFVPLPADRELIL